MIPVRIINGKRCTQTDANVKKIHMVGSLKLSINEIVVENKKGIKLFLQISEEFHFHKFYSILDLDLDFKIVYFFNHGIVKK